MMVYTDGVDGKVKQFPYRSAMVHDQFMSLPREACEELERRLAEQAGTTPDNHTVYEITYDRTGKNEITYLWFTDFKVYFGRKIVIGSW